MTTTKGVFYQSTFDGLIVLCTEDRSSGNNLPGTTIVPEKDERNRHWGNGYSSQTWNLHVFKPIYPTITVIDDTLYIRGIKFASIQPIFKAIKLEKKPTPTQLTLINKIAALYGYAVVNKNILK